MESPPLSYQLPATPNLRRQYRPSKTSLALAVAGLFLLFALLALILLILVPEHIDPSTDVVPSPSVSVTVRSLETTTTTFPEVLEPSNDKGHEHE